MGSFANSLFTLMLGWLQGAVSAIWSAFTSQNGSSLLNWIGRRWILIAAILCAIGLAADLCVYILRWKPFRVWKSFFYRKEPEGQAEYAVPDNSQPVFSRGGPEPMTEHEKPEPVFNREAEREPEPDFSQWETEKPAEREMVQPAVKPPTITNAGYIVPADSPYRRPSENHAEQQPVQTEEADWNSGRREERNEPAPVTQRRRRRISVSELFSDPEEELRQYDAPQHVIDSRQAYHAPVYPRRWKKNEEEGQ